MTDGALSDRDTAVMDSAMGQPDGKDEVAALRERVAELEVELDAERDTNQQLRQDLANVANRVSDLEAAVEGGDQITGSTQLERYSSLDGDLEEKLSASERRAVAIYELWPELSMEDGEGRWYVDTKRNSTAKYQPNRTKRKLEQDLDEDLHWEQVYRAMKRLAELSGGEAAVDQHGRKHVTGGEWEYHEKTSPDNTDHTTYKLLVEVGE
ncbi:hypothetical protein DP107_04335 [Haloglomus irregulare]|jgi:hypothetical protein|uniref:Uncharacterized protein n=1 Tax=Haloglomus irregulare TaxID=2234134 RepID=A0A554NCJ3_9EURY|nr:hypothetical protein [Haloglomus irregulare]TSD15088.1 hypothetical protein DP107_04335 [Haloglomus irregulare]